MRRTASSVRPLRDGIFHPRNTPIVLVAALGALAIICPCLAADDTGAEQFETLRKRIETARATFFAEHEKAKTHEEREAITAPYPAQTMVQDFLDLEERFRGTQAAFSVLHNLVTQAGAGGSPDIAKGRQEALRRLASHYASHPDLDVMFDWLSSGVEGPEDKPFLKRAAESPHRYVRGTARLALARSYATGAQLPALVDANLGLLRSQPEKNKQQVEWMTEMRSRWKDVDPADSRRQSLTKLDEVSRHYADVPEAPRTLYGPMMIRIERSNVDALTKVPRRPIGELAEALRFGLMHLSIGQTCPKLTRPTHRANR